MANVILLLGAGFSKNWGGPLATDVTIHLKSLLQSDARVCDLLNGMNFEDVLSRLREEFLLLGKGNYAPQEERLTAFEEALSAEFDHMNKQFQSRQFEFSQDVSRGVGRFLTGFEAIFTLNQDLLLELHYHGRENVGLWHNTRWQGAEMPGLRPLPPTDPFDRTSMKWRPEEPFQSNTRMQPYYKLHGSSGWQLTDGGKPLLVIGRDKTGTIAERPILRWTYEQFEQYLQRDDTRLMVIGYGFGDDHINQSLVDAHRAGKLKMIYLVHPEGKAIISSKCPDLLKVPCVECTVLISAAFTDDDMALDLMRGIFR